MDAVNSDYPQYPKILTLEEAAKILRVHRSTVSRVAGSGELKSHTIGNRRLFYESDVYDFFDRRAEKESVSGNGKED